MGFCNGYDTALKRNGEFGANFDVKAIQWKRAIEQDYAAILELESVTNGSFEEAKELRRLTNSAPNLFKVSTIIFF